MDSRRDTSSKITQIDSSEPFFYNFDTEVRQLTAQRLTRAGVGVLLQVRLVLEGLVARAVERSLRECLAEEEDKLSRAISRRHEDEMAALRILEKCQ